MHLALQLRLLHYYYFFFQFVLLTYEETVASLLSQPTSLFTLTSQSYPDMDRGIHEWLCANPNPPSDKLSLSQVSKRLSILLSDFVFGFCVSLSPRWKSLYQVLLTTRTSLKVEREPGWIYATRCRRGPKEGADGAKKWLIHWSQYWHVSKSFTQMNQSLDYNTTAGQNKPHGIRQSSSLDIRRWHHTWKT